MDIINLSYRYQLYQLWLGIKCFMLYIQNGLIIHLTNTCSLKNNIC